MPIGFWAISRDDLKRLWAFQNERYPAQEVEFIEKDISQLAREIPEYLDTLTEQEVTVQMEHRRTMNQKHR